MLTVKGSSPRMRGTASIEKIADAQNGIIPAYAGNSHQLNLVYDNLEDHPRVCGEQVGEAGAEAIVPGSSPRMRGTEYMVGGYNE